MKIVIRQLEKLPFVKNDQSKIDWKDTGNLFAWAVIIFSICYIFIYHAGKFFLK